MSRSPSPVSVSQPSHRGTRRSWVAVAVAGLSVVALAACGDDTPSASPATTVDAGDQPAGAAVVITSQEGKAMMDAAGDELTIIDVRTPEEYAAGHVEGAINLDVQGGGFSASIAELDPAASYIVYCQSGRRSAIAAATMVAAGFTQVHDMGGIQAWIDAGLPVVAA